MKTLCTAAMLALLMAGPAYSADKTDKAQQTETIMANADIKVGLSGLVCDFFLLR